MRRRCCSASTASRRCARSKPPTACWACPWRVDRPARRPGDLRVGLRRHVLFRRRGSDEPPAGFAPAGTTPRGTSATLRSRATTSRSRSSPSCFPSATTTREPGSSRSSRATVLPLLGEAAPALWRAARAAVGSWAWSETILVTEDPDDPALRAEAAADPLLARHVLFCGDPASLPAGMAARCAVVTMDPVAASDLTVLVDRQAATLHPMGHVVRPHLQSAETAEQIADWWRRPKRTGARRRSPARGGNQAGRVRRSRRRHWRPERSTSAS